MRSIVVCTWCSAHSTEVAIVMYDSNTFPFVELENKHNRKKNRNKMENSMYGGGNISCIAKLCVSAARCI